MTGRRQAGAAGRTLIAAAAALLAASLEAAEPVPLRTCLLANSPPYSMRADTAGFDVDTAAAAAKIIGRPFEAVWDDNATNIQEIEGDIPFARLARGDCDVLFSIPGPARQTLAGQPALALGEAYYGAAFELVTCAHDAPKALRALRERDVAIQSQTVAHFALLMVKAKPRTYFAVPAAIEGLLSGEATAGLLWGPAAGWHILARPFEGCGVAAGYEPPAAVRWNVHAATRGTDQRLRLLLNAALADLAATGRLAEIAARYGMPMHAPFESTYSMGALNELQWTRE